MKTQIKKQDFVKNSNIDPKLINAVVNQFGGYESFTDYAEDVTNHGIDAGFSGFTYYTDTHSFAMQNRKLIVALLEETASELGEDVVSMVSHFGVFRNSPMDAEDKKELYKYLGGGRPQQSAITNVMAWFAAEEVCRSFTDYLQS